jgi:hypothetical protein
MVMAVKLLEIPPDVPGDVVECGTWKGGSAANLSLVCRVVGRKLKIYDSFEGLPEPEPEESRIYTPGGYMGTMNEVMHNIKRYGAIECCEFIKGNFKYTLPALKSPVALAYLDVDLDASLHTCVKHIWPNLINGGYLFTDEYILLQYVALFYSEKWWKTYMNENPPGLLGAGSGIPLGSYYVGPWHEGQPIPVVNTVAYTQKGLSAYWTYYPEA